MNSDVLQMHLILRVCLFEIQMYDRKQIYEYNISVYFNFYFYS